MTTNERIARGLGYAECPDGCGKSIRPDTGGHYIPPDYEHSLDALLEPLGVLRERGWYWSVDTYIDGRFGFFVGRWDGKVKDIEQIGTDLVPIAALAVADALEASQ